MLCEAVESGPLGEGAAGNFFGRSLGSSYRRVVWSVVFVSAGPPAPLRPRSLPFGQTQGRHSCVLSWPDFILLLLEQLLRIYGWDLVCCGVTTSTQTSDPSFRSMYFRTVSNQRNGRSATTRRRFGEGGDKISRSSSLCNAKQSNRQPHAPQKVF